MVTLDPLPTTTEGGVHLPANLTKDPTKNVRKATIHYIGVDVPEGIFEEKDRILLPHFRAQEEGYEFNDKNFHKVDYRHVIAVIEDD